VREDIVRVLNGRRFTVFFSGGRDSLAALLWVIDNVPDVRGMRIIYAEVTGNTHPDCTAYVRDVVERLDLTEHFVLVKRDDISFWDFMRKVGPPVFGPARWCLNEFKRKAWRAFVHGPIAVLGIRAGESATRARYKNFHRTFDGQFTLMPIFSWTKDQVLSYIKEHGLYLNPCYARYGHSGNCMWCLYYSRWQIIRTLADPVWGPKIEHELSRAPVRGPVQARIRNYWLRLAGQTLLEVATA